MKKLSVLLILISAVITTVARCQSTITFDNITADMPGNDYTLIPNGYAGLNWNNFAVVNIASFPLSSGYLNGMKSAPNVAYNNGSNPAILTASSTFALVSGFFGAAWNNGLSLEVIGINGSTAVYDNTFTLNTSGPSLLTFPSASVTEVEFESSGGTNAGYQGAGAEFVLDNLTIAAVPEPSTWALMAGGAVLLGAVRQQRKK